MSVPSFSNKWRKIINSTGSIPKPRHGHRAVAVNDFMIVFGGGNDGMVDELHVYQSNKNQWVWPSMKGEIPSGRAAYGIACDGSRLFIFAGMVEYGRYTNELYELKLCSWEWQKLLPTLPDGCEPPKPRLGHSFTMHEDKIYMFGGLTNDATSPQYIKPKYLNDLYILDLSEGYKWVVPKTYGTPPCPRESHTAIIFRSNETGTSKMLIYGGMNGIRLGDYWVLDLKSMIWGSIQTTGNPPLPRSLHTAELHNGKMYIFGGWIPANPNNPESREWKCTNTLAILDLERSHWISYQEFTEDNAPKARAGHSSVIINSRLYIWSGRDGYRKAWNNQVCCRDLWYLELEKPRAPSRIQLLKATTVSIEITWLPVPNADCYIVQIREISTDESVSETTSSKVSQTNSTSRIRLIPAKTYGKNQIVIKPANNSKALSSPQIMTLVRSADGTLKLEKLNNATKISKVFVCDETTIPSTSKEQSKSNSEAVEILNQIINNSSTDEKIPQTDGPEDNEKNEENLNNSSSTSLCKDSSEKNWCDVGIFKTNNCSIKSYFVGVNTPERDFCSDSYPTYENYSKRNVKSESMYQVRVAGVNLQGRGSWCQTENFLKTCAPGLPLAPSNIKVTKSEDGVFISWSSPATTISQNLKHHVYMAIKTQDEEPACSTSNLVFTKIYSGQHNSCVVNSDYLVKAYVDRSDPSKPIVIFRVTTENSKGFGPATQIKWAYDPNEDNTLNSAVSTRKNFLKRYLNEET